MTIVDTNPLFEKKQELIRRIDKNISDGAYGSDFNSNIDYQKHIEILSNLDNKCREATIENIRKAQLSVKEVNTTHLKEKHQERLNPTGLRKIFNTKYQQLLDQYEAIKLITDTNLKLKKEGRELKEEMTSMIKNKKSWDKHTKEEQEIINKILRM